MLVLISLKHISSIFSKFSLKTHINTHTHIVNQFAAIPLGSLFVLPAKETIQSLTKLETVQKTPTEVYPNMGSTFPKFPFQEFPEV